LGDENKLQKRTKPKINPDFILLFAHLFVTLTLGQVTFVRKSKRKNDFSFAFRSLIRNFAAEKGCPDS